MIVVECALLVPFFVCDIKFAGVPILLKQFIRDKAIVAAVWIGVMDLAGVMSPQRVEHPRFPSTYYLYSFDVVVKP